MSNSKQNHMTLHSWLPWCEPRLTDLKQGDFVEVIQRCFLFLVRVISKAVDCGIAPDGNTICPKQSPISLSTYKNIICLKTTFPVLWTHECAQLSHETPIFHNVVCTLHVYQVIVCKLVQHSAHVYAVKLYNGGPKNNENFFLEGRGAVLPSAPAWCVYLTALCISWPSSVLEERSVGSMWFFFLSLCHCLRQFFDGRLKRTMCLHHVLFPFGENSSRNGHNASRGF